MRELVGESSLPTMTLDVSDNDISQAADRVADWLKKTGGCGSRKSLSVGIVAGKVFALKLNTGHYPKTKDE